MLLSEQRFLSNALIVLFSVVLLSACGSKTESEQAESAPADPDQIAAEQIYRRLMEAGADIPSHEIINTLSSDQTDKVEVETWIVLSAAPTEENVRALLKHYHVRISVQGPWESRATPTDIKVYVFPSAAAAEDYPDGWIGRSIKTTNEADPVVEVNL